MAWFRRSPEESERDVWAAFVSVRSASGGRAEGCGVVVSPGSVLTCAHVVNAALGRSPWAQASPRGRTVTVRFPGRGAATATTRVSAWIPPRSHRGGAVTDGEISWQGDLALLELLPPVPPVDVLPPWGALRETQRLRARSYDGGPAGTVGVVVRSTDPHGCFVDPDEWPGPGIAPGYSGGPLWCPGEGVVVGLVCGVLQDRGGTAGGFSRRGFVLPSQQIFAEFEGMLGTAAASELIEALRPRSGSTAAESARGMQLRYLVERAMPGREERLRQGRRLAEKCGLPEGPPDTAPTSDDFVAVMLERHGVAATLIEGLDTGDSRHLGPLVDAGLRIPTPGLLSQDERRLLHSLLDRLTAQGAVTPTDFDEAASVARPGARPDPALSCTTCPAEQIPQRRRWFVRHLEGFTGARGDEERIVPPLLRFAEQLAAQAAAWARDEESKELARALQAWSSAVARRLRLSEEALREHRNSAADYAAARRRSEARTSHAARVVVRLVRYQHGQDQGRYRVTLWADFGEGRLTQLAGAGDVPLSPPRAARLIRETVASLRGDGSPVLEVFLDETELALDVDEWDSSAPDSTDREPLGATLPIAVRVSMELERTQEQELLQSFTDRWKRADLGELMDIGDRCTTENHVKSVVWASPHAARAVLRTADPGMRAALAVVCLRLGVPFVLWDRRADKAVATDHFDDLAPDQPAAGLPERVRRYRAQAMGFPEEHPARPVLAWQDPRRPPPPPLPLLDPTDSAVHATATPDEETTRD